MAQQLQLLDELMEIIQNSYTNKPTTAKKIFDDSYYKIEILKNNQKNYIKEATDLIVDAFTNRQEPLGIGANLKGNTVRLEVESLIKNSIKTGKSVVAIHCKLNKVIGAVLCDDYLINV